MDRSRIAEILQPFLDAPLHPVQHEQIAGYLDLLLRWNARVNLTAIRDPEQIIARHFGESLFAARHLFPAGQSVSGIHLDNTRGTTPGQVDQSPTDGVPPSPESELRGRETRSSRLETSASVRLIARTDLDNTQAVTHPKVERAATKDDAADQESGLPNLGTRNLKLETSPNARSSAPTSSPLETRPAVLDLGSGAGFPGLPLWIFAPHIHLTLVESNARKVAFLREAARLITTPRVEAPPSLRLLTSPSLPPSSPFLPHRLSPSGSAALDPSRFVDVDSFAASGLDTATPRATSINVDVLNARAEALPRAQADLVTLRAVEHFAAILPTAARLVRPAGRLALLITTAQLEILHRLTPTFHWNPPLPVPPSDSRILVIGSAPR